jgi:hypothetical protein
MQGIASRPQTLFSALQISDHRNDEFLPGVMTLMSAQHKDHIQFTTT